MATLRQKRDGKGALSKTAAFKLGLISKLHKKIGRKLLAISLCVTLVLLGAPATTFAEEPTTFVTSATAHHWGRSDLRAYLNNGLTDEDLTWDPTTGKEITTTKKNYEISSSASNNGDGYAEHFNQEEFNLIKPFTYYTNVLDMNGNQESNYTRSTFETTDRFWIPCGYCDKTFAISWSADDTSNRKFESKNKNLDRNHVIPKSYFCTPNAGKEHTWLRSTYIENTGKEKKLKNTVYGEQKATADPTNEHSVGAAFKIDLESIDFASVASAKDILNIGSTTLQSAAKLKGSKQIDVSKDTSDGMYLKLTVTQNEGKYSPQTVTLKNEKDPDASKDSPCTYLTFSDTGLKTCEKTDNYIVIQAYNKENSGKCFVAAKKVSSTTDAINIDISGWEKKTRTNLNGYVIRTWLEYGNAELPYATSATKFVVTESGIKKENEMDLNWNPPKCPRLYAEKDSLQCSWGDLSALSDTDYDKVLAGTAADETGAITGKNPTNQKIYFGSYEVTENDKKIIKPMEFWIAGIEKYPEETDKSGKTIVKVENGDGTIDPNGNIMTLYQAKSVETKTFNETEDSYTGNPVTLRLKDGQKSALTSTAGTNNKQTITYPSKFITLKFPDLNDSEQIDAFKKKLIWQHRRRTTAWTAGMPTRPGIYEIRCYVEGTDTYERTYSNVVKFTVNGALTSSDFKFQASDADYDGETHPVNLVDCDTKNPEKPYLMLPPDLPLTDKVKMIIQYGYKNGTETEWSDTAPQDAGSYMVGIKVEATGSQIYLKPTNEEPLYNDDWKFTISTVNPSHKKPEGTITATYGDTLESLNNQLDKPTGVNNTALSGTWSWEQGDKTTVGNVGQHTFTAKFAPDDKTNYNWTNIAGWDDPKGFFTFSVKVNVYQANPSYKSPEKPLTAVFGDQLSKLEEQLVAPEGVNGTALGGYWSFKDKYGKLIDKNTILNEFGEQEYTAVFKPTDSNYQTARIKFKVNVTADTSNWGSEEVRTDGKTQYVNAQGRTSVEMSSGNLDENSILWLREESYDASAWYGIDLSENAFDLDKGHRFYVQWLSPNDTDYQTYYSLLDDARKAEVEGNKGWIFLIGVEDHKSKTVQPRKPVKVYVQIGDDWNKEDLQGYYISSEHDEQVETTFVDNLAYPAGTDTFGLMTLSHFSPYFIYDKLNDKEKAAFDALTDEEKAQLDTAAKELAAQRNDKSDERTGSESERNSSGSSAKTGDKIIYFTISGVSLMMTLALGLMLNSKINRRKLDK